MSVGVQKRSDRVTRDPNGGFGRGSAQEWPLNLKLSAWPTIAVSAIFWTTVTRST